METKNIYNLIILDESGSMGSIERQAVSTIAFCCAAPGTVVQI